MKKWRKKHDQAGGVSSQKRYFHYFIIDRKKNKNK